MKKVCIIGGGVAGLTAGILAQKEGYSCEIYEKNPVPGGNLTGWERDGCYIDNCMHWLNGTQTGTRLHALWEETGALGDVEILGRDAFYTSEWEGKTISLWRDSARTRRDMLLLSPVDKPHILRFMDAVDALAKNPRRAAWVWLRYGGMTLGELAAKFLHPLLQCLLTDLLTEDFSAAGLLFAYAAFTTGNADLPRGGSRAMAQRMAARFVSFGGQLHTGKAAAMLQTAGQKVTALILEDGTRVEADAFLCCCDPTGTFAAAAARGQYAAAAAQAVSGQ